MIAFTYLAFLCFFHHLNVIYLDPELYSKCKERLILSMKFDYLQVCKLPVTILLNLGGHSFLTPCSIRIVCADTVYHTLIMFYRERLSGTISSN